MHIQDAVDLDADVVFGEAVLRRHFDRAERMLVKYGLQQRLRSLDALHLGIALDLHERGHVDTLVTTDSLLADVAKKEGLAVQNPLVP